MKKIGLDFSDQAGQTLPLRTYKAINEVERDHDIRAHLLLANKKVAGASKDQRALNVNPHKPK